MNFLAHIYLSPHQEKVMVGNFVGDFVKGKAFEEYDQEIQKGILLHREIDRYTDVHEVVTQSKERLRPKYHHYAPVIIDIFYDHFLASMWEEYHVESLISFTERFYQMMSKYLDMVPKKAVRMFSYMKRDNWLYHYKFTEGVHRALSGMARRTPFESKMEHATKDLKKDYDAYKEEFTAFFPDLEKHARQYLDTLK